MAARIHPKTSLGPVHLTTGDMARSAAFYRQALGLQVHQQASDRLHLGAGGPDLIVLVEILEAPKILDTTGLYHLALLLPSRLALAHSLQQIVKTQTSVQGFADHGVSEAVYLADPDGNGIELYYDRPRNQWPRESGKITMGTDPLEVGDLLAELAGSEDGWEGLSPETVTGHIHLQVADLPIVEIFYRELLGFELVMRQGASASFLSAGGYHHHIACNTWAGQGAPPPPLNSIGLRQFTIRLPNQAALKKVTNRIQRAGLEIEEQPDGFFLQDPSQNGILLTSAK